MEHVKVYRSKTQPKRIFIHKLTTPVFIKYTSNVSPRIEFIKGNYNGYTGDSRYVYGDYPWIPTGELVECYYDKDQGILL